MANVQVERFYLGCLAHASYAVCSDGIAAIIDPQRDVEIYLDAAARNNCKIEHIIETHLHADFVSGHRELADRTGAQIYIGAGSGALFPHVEVKDGDETQFGQCRFRFLQTPGHTLESICIVMTDLGEPGRPRAVFTGDTLFVGDVGRPDLSATHTPQELARLLYRSISEKLLALPDDTEIFPAHGAGSLCGRQMSSESSSTIGKERRTNYALLARDADEFVHLLTDSLPTRPEYFAREVDLNRRGAAPLRELANFAPFTPQEVLQLRDGGVAVVDTRPAMDFAAAHVPKSIHIGLTGQYASWAARILGLDTRLILVGEDAGHVQESRMRLARVGLENVAGYLAGGITEWVKDGLELDYLPQVTAQDLFDLQTTEADGILILDVREMHEVREGAIDNSVRIPLGELQARMSELDAQKLIVVHCKGGYRSSIAASLLERAGFSNIANLAGGFDAWKTAGFPYRVAEGNAN
jgi:glyoxylase-like metal-dependent hydrolase (beta-lactamase superfamily II)/rhodanese-related sulfurtransferase